jgi:MOSC domain-containing protein YiiM
MRGRVVALWTKPRHGRPMEERERVAVKAGHGIVGNADQGGRRQVTIIDADRWQQVQEQLGEVPASSRRANVMLAGVPLAGTRERILRVGEVRLRIRGETRPCHQMEAAWPGLRDALRPDWGGGAFAEVLDDGEIAVGQEAAFEEPAPPLAQGSATGGVT